MKILVTRKIPEPGLRKLKNFNAQLTINQEDRNLKHEELNNLASDADAVLAMLADNIDADFLKSHPGLKIIANYAVGFNNVDIEAATNNNVVVTNTPGVLTDTTADLAWSLLMAISRRVVEADKYTRAGKFKGWAPELHFGSDIYGKTLGIIGAGRIGQATARRAAGFDMKVLYHSRSQKEDFEKETGALKVGLDNLLKESDFVSLHVPLTDETHYMIDADELRLMKNNAFLINTARGPVINEKILARALQENWIAGAALDVFEEEPKVHPQLLNLDNVILTPHIGSATDKTRNKMAEMAAESIIDVLSGQKPENVVNSNIYDK
ncbi:MAG: D-glycerate dehydrogenase [Candidatus Marinimicrobia bacterium]|nr:D-glycerate dehydrogenase [Candidatus Neomarinimicrobiota bacterium]